MHAAKIVLLCYMKNVYRYHSAVVQPYEVCTNIPKCSPTKFVKVLSFQQELYVPV